MAWQDSNDYQRKYDNIEQWSRVCAPLGIPTPAFTEGESFDHQRKRIIEKVRPFVSDELQPVKTDHVFETGLNDLERRFMDSAAREAARPTKVPDGELKQVTRYDQAGRPYYEFFGKCSTWLSDFTSPKKRLVGIRTHTERGYHPGNLG
jgi:hypothetical protein